jgi:hypothetical protein
MTTKIRLLTIGLATALLATSAVGAFAKPVLIPIGHGPVIGAPGSGVYHGPVYPVGYGPIWSPYGGGDWWWWWHHHYHHHHHHHHYEYPL